MGCSSPAVAGVVVGVGVRVGSTPGCSSLAAGLGRGGRRLCGRVGGRRAGGIWWTCFFFIFYLFGVVIFVVVIVVIVVIGWLGSVRGVVVVAIAEVVVAIDCASSMRTMLQGRGGDVGLWARWYGNVSNGVVLRPGKEVRVYERMKCFFMQKWWEGGRQVWREKGSGLVKQPRQ